MPEDAANRAHEHDGCHETHAAAAGGALQDVDLEPAAHELGPGAITWAGDLPGSARWKLVRSLRTPEAHDLRPPLGIRREHAVIHDEVHVGARNESRELFEKLLRLQGNVTRPVAPRRLETDEHPSIRRE